MFVRQRHGDRRLVRKKRPTVPLSFAAFAILTLSFGDLRGVPCLRRLRRPQRGERTTATSSATHTTTRSTIRWIDIAPSGFWGGSFLLDLRVDRLDAACRPQHRQQLVGAFALLGLTTYSMTVTPSSRVTTVSTLHFFVASSSCDSTIGRMRATSRMRTINRPSGFRLDPTVGIVLARARPGTHRDALELFARHVSEHFVIDARDERPGSRELARARQPALGVRPSSATGVRPKSVSHRAPRSRR